MATGAEVRHAMRPRRYGHAGSPSILPRRQNLLKNLTPLTRIWFLVFELNSRIQILVKGVRFFSKLWRRGNMLGSPSCPYRLGRRA